MKYFFKIFFITLVSLFIVSTLHAKDNYQETISVFKNGGESGEFFSKSYAYAVFPTVGKGGLGIGGAYGKGRVYEKNKFVGKS